MSWKELMSVVRVFKYQGRGEGTKGERKSSVANISFLSEDKGI